MWSVRPLEIQQLWSNCWGKLFWKPTKPTVLTYWFRILCLLDPCLLICLTLAWILILFWSLLRLVTLKSRMLRTVCMILSLDCSTTEHPWRDIYVWNCHWVSLIFDTQLEWKNVAVGTENQVYYGKSNNICFSAANKLHELVSAAKQSCNWKLTSSTSSAPIFVSCRNVCYCNDLYIMYICACIMTKFPNFCVRPHVELDLIEHRGLDTPSFKLLKGKGYGQCHIYVI